MNTLIDIAIWNWYNNRILISDVGNINEQKQLPSSLSSGNEKCNQRAVDDDDGDDGDDGGGEVYWGDM